MLLVNKHSNYQLPLDDKDSQIFDEQSSINIQSYLTRIGNHSPNPLHTLTGLAKEQSVKSIHVKDEGSRLGLGSFKALGGSYAVYRVLLEETSKRLNRTIKPNELSSGEVRRICKTITVTCATDGNHGLSVAYGAKIWGANAVIFVHSGVSSRRIESLVNQGANIEVVNGTYDDSVIEAESVSKKNGWLLVSDTSWYGYERIPQMVMHGYTRIVDEALQGLSDVPTHVFLQAGVGGMAAAIAGKLFTMLKVNCPKIIVVEPSRAACLFETSRHGALKKVENGESTIMAMLECYQPSLVAWRILSHVADSFLTIEDDEAIAAMNLLAKPIGTDRPIIAGESGAAGLAGFMSVIDNSAHRSLLGINQDSRILIINTEGATDLEVYEKLVGLKPNDIASESNK